LHPRPDYQAEAGVLENILKAASPVFDKSTEDGMRYRIYSIGSLQVRTTQEHDGEEHVVAVFSVRLSSAARTLERHVEPCEKIVKVSEYVEKSRLGVLAPGVARPRDPMHTYYVVLETSGGHTIASEKLADGRLTWEENPADLDDRNSLAKVVRAMTLDDKAESSTVGDIQRYRLGEMSKKEVSSASKRKNYAHGLFLWALSRGPRFPGMNFGAWRQAADRRWKQTLMKDYSELRAKACSGKEGATARSSVGRQAESGPCADCGVSCHEVANDGQRYCDACWSAYVEGKPRDLGKKGSPVSASAGEGRDSAASTAGSEASTTTAPSSDSDHVPAAAALRPGRFDGLSARKLKDLAKCHGLDIAGCAEKVDLIAVLLAADVAMDN